MAIIYARCERRILLETEMGSFNLNDIEQNVDKRKFYSHRRLYSIFIMRFDRKSLENHVPTNILKCIPSNRFLMSNVIGSVVNITRMNVHRACSTKLTRYVFQRRFSYWFSAATRRRFFSLLRWHVVDSPKHLQSLGCDSVSSWKLLIAQKNHFHLFVT